MRAVGIGARVIVRLESALDGIALGATQLAARGAHRVTPLVSRRFTERVRRPRPGRLDGNRRKGIERVHRREPETLLELEGHVHEAHLRIAFRAAQSRQPEASLIQPVFHGDRADLRMNRRDERLDPDGDLVLRGGILFSYHGPDVHRHGEAIGGAHELAAARVEPHGADDVVPFRLSRAHAQLAQHDRARIGQAECHRVACLVRVIGFGAFGERMNDVAFVDLRLHDLAAAERNERFLAREIGQRRHVLIVQVVRGLLFGVLGSHRNCRARAPHVDPCAHVTMPPHARDVLVPEYQPVAANLREAHARRDAQVRRRVVAQQGRILRHAR